MKTLSVLILSLALVTGAFAQKSEGGGSGTGNANGDAAETINNAPGGAIVAPGAPQGYFGSGSILFDNGPLLTGTGTGTGGADVSVVDTAAGFGTFGYAHQLTGAFRVADDFTVPDSWNVGTITFFSYQTGSTTTSTINDYSVAIWDGVPGAPGSSIVWGDTAANVLDSTSWTGIYRVLDTDLSATNRPIMANTIVVNTIFPAGTYYIDWAAGGSLASGPWAPPVTIPGTGNTGDALQLNVTWGPLIATGVNEGQGMPFVMTSGADVPTLGEWGMLAFISLLLVTGLVYIRKTRTA